MKAWISAAALGLALALGGCGESEGDLNQAAAQQNAPLPNIAAPNGGDWTQMAAETPEGGFRLGNPDAPVKLVEYASISCGACAAFAEQGSEPLRERFVRSGQVSWEYRPYVIFPTDPGIFMLLRCQGAQAFFSQTDQLYATQRTWLAQAQQQAEQVQSVPPQQRVAAFVQAAGVDQFFRQRGMPAGRVQSCLADQNALQQVLTTSQRYAEEDDVTGTPTFFINGRQLENVGDWRHPDPSRSLEARLRAAVGNAS